MHMPKFRLPWGTNDCALFAANAILAITGTDIASDFRGKYSDEAGAFALIKSVTGGTTVADAAAWCAAKHGLVELAHPLQAQRGICWVVTNGRNLIRAGGPPERRHVCQQWRRRARCGCRSFHCEGVAHMSKAIEGAATAGRGGGFDCGWDLRPSPLHFALYDTAIRCLPDGREHGGGRDCVRASPAPRHGDHDAAAGRRTARWCWGSGALAASRSTKVQPDLPTISTNYIIAIAGHQIDSIVNLYLDGRQVFWHGSGVRYCVRNGVGFGGIADGNNHTGPDGTQYNFGGTGHSGIYCEARLATRR